MKVYDLHVLNVDGQTVKRFSPFYKFVDGQQIQRSSRFTFFASGVGCGQQQILTHVSSECLETVVKQPNSTFDLPWSCGAGMVGPKKHHRNRPAHLFEHAITGSGN